MMSSPMITYYTGQSDAVADVFTRAVHDLAGEHYGAEQLAAWAPRPIDYAHWRRRCELKRPFLYVDGDTVCGFLELDPDGHIDCHYVHPDHHRRGIGGRLLRHVVHLADALPLPRLVVEASHLAKGLYLKHGFRVVRANRVVRRGVSFENWLMERSTG
jgi:ribosomal protein S18 acetylase RimI-like enzyme